MTPSPRPIPILTYHQVDPPAPRGAPYRSLSVSPAAFARQMAWLAALGYRGLSMSALMPYLRGEQSGRVVGLTFDDGYRNNLIHALPVLRRHGFSATCFVVSDMIGQSNAWDASLGIAEKPLMTLDELRSWHDGGQEVGAHTGHHVDLCTLGEADARAEIAGSKRSLESALQTEVRHFCYPYGRYRPEHASWAREAGYESACTTRRGRAPAGADPFELPRVPVPRFTPLPLFWLKVASAYEDRRA